MESKIDKKNKDRDNVDLRVSNKFIPFLGKVFLVSFLIFFCVVVLLFLLLYKDGKFFNKRDLETDTKIKVVQNKNIDEILKSKLNKDIEEIKKEEKVKIPIKKDLFKDLSVISAHSAAIIDVGTGNVLYAKNASERRAIASTTKLMTAVLVVDRIKNLDEYIEVPEDVLYIEGTKVGCITSTICRHNRLQVGEKVKVRDLMKAMLMNSANDAATLLGKHVSGSENQFAELMNIKAKELKLDNTHFCRPSGLEVDPPRREDECYSSAYDIGRVMAYILKNKDKYKEILDIMQTKETEIHSKDGTIVHELKNTNRLLEKDTFIVGAKTGFTPRAGFCLVSYARDKNNNEIVAVVLDDLKRFDDIDKMTKWAFDNYNWY